MPLEFSVMSTKSYSKKNKTLALWLLICYAQAIAQVQPSASLPDYKTTPAQSWTGWQRVGMDLNQISFVHWNAGGTNAISGIVKVEINRSYTQGNTKWINECLMRYGLSQQEGIGWRKTDDMLRINSTFGHRRDSLSLWYYSAKFNLNTQFANGYAYPNVDTPISKAMAPAYVFLGIGAEYAFNDKSFSCYASPLTMKNTLVLDTFLADQGAFGVRKAVYDDMGNRIQAGEKVRTEVGILFVQYFKRKVFENGTLESRSSFYTDYLNHFGNIDVDWQLQLDLTVNQYVHANIGTHLIYDDDIKAKEEVNGQQVSIGPRIQLKQILAVGILYVF